MTTIDTLVIGAGHAGLAVSRLLTHVGHDHVVLDRGRIGERWRSERWDSLHLLTPNWLTRLPGWSYHGSDQDGYMSAERFVGHLERYAESFAAPVVGGTTVTALAADADRYLVSTDRGTWRSRHVVIATGPHGTPHVPATPRGAETVTASRYKNPDQLSPGGVLVVGASSSGVQIADELARAGRDVVVSVGQHTRMPRRYRGMDAFWWLESTGRLARTIDTVRDPFAARHEPSLQLVGRNQPPADGADLDLRTLRERGVRLTGRLAGFDGPVAHFRDDLTTTAARADLAMHRFLDVADHYAATHGLDPEILPPRRPSPVDTDASLQRLDLAAERIGTVLFATGYRPDYPWLRLPITGPDGHIRQHRGVTSAPGVYVVGQRFQHRRDAGFIDGARHTARDVVAHLLGRAAAREEHEEPAA